MAYLSPTTLTCPTCGFAARIKLVEGVGPGSRRGDIPYRRYNSAPPFAEHLDAKGKPTGTLLCPKDATPVWTNQPSATMEGPLTEREMAHRKRASANASKMSRRAGGPMKPIQPKRSS